MTTIRSKKFENDQTKVLQKILQDTIDIEELMAEKRRTANQDGDQTILEEESNTRPKKVIKFKDYMYMYSVCLRLNYISISDPFSL